MLADLGFNEYAHRVALDTEKYPAHAVARVIEEHRTRWVLASNDGQLSASIRGTIHYDLDTEAFPKVGDWVRFTLAGKGTATIEEILPRATKITRKNINNTGTQVMVTNVDTVAIVQGIDQDFNISKILRYIEIARESGATPIVVFTKADLTADVVSSHMKALTETAPEVPLIAISARTNDGMDKLMTYLKPHQTIVLMGASGAGKSTLLNKLMQSDIQDTQAVRTEDGKGRHTTTRRSLFVLPSGALVIDTPGMRELTSAIEKKEDMFEDVVEISYGCKYPNCDHVKSLNCAIQEALNDGSLSQERYDAYMKFLAKQKANEETYASKNTHSDRVKSNRATLNYQSRRQSEDEE